MKKGILTLLVTVFISILGYTQSIENLDYISPFHNEVAAIKKGDQWAFINKEGEIIIDFRNDLVISKHGNESYPVFENDRCLIVKKKADISYFGYINKTGKVVIEFQFLNATNFNNNIATVLKLVKENVGKNEVLGKDIVYYKYFEVIIDTNGNIKNYLINDGIYVALDKKFVPSPPPFKSKQMSKNLHAIINKNKTWSIIKTDK